MQKKILFLSHKFYSDIGGIEVNSEILARSFYESGHEVRVLTWSEDSTRKVFPFAVIRDPNIIDLFREHAWADLVFENNPCVRLGWPSLFFERPSVIVLNTWLDKVNGKFKINEWVKFRWIKRARQVISVSDAVCRGCWPTSIVIRNPYRANLFRILPDVNRTADFVFVGRLVSQKGVDLLILAFHRLLSMTQEDKTLNKTSSLTIVGDGPERGKLERLVVDLKLEKYVSFAGFLQGDRLINHLNRHKFLVVPSLLKEAFGNVVLEGIACGCIPIVSNSGGLPEAVGNAGVVFKTGDLDDLVACIHKLQSDPDLTQRLRKAASEHLAAHHPNKVSQRYLQVIETIDSL